MAGNGGVYGDLGLHCGLLSQPAGCSDARGERPANAETGIRAEGGKVDLVSCFGEA